MHEPEILEFDFVTPLSRPVSSGIRPESCASKPLVDQLIAFREFGAATVATATRVELTVGGAIEVPTFTNEFWTSKQRAANSLHEISYRACFKPSLPRFFIERFTKPGDVVYDPFMGRGTTLIEAALLERVPYGCDINPLSVVLTRPRLNPPTLEAVARRLQEIPLDDPDSTPEDLLVFYHPGTLREIASLKKFLFRRRAENALDSIDEWITLVSLNRLTGHSVGYFSVYTLPPNQAVSVKSQRRINARRNQTPPPRNIRDIILKKTRSLLMDCSDEVRQSMRRAGEKARLLTCPASATHELPDQCVDLVVTSPPFLSVVDYAGDNWLRCWFLGIDAKSVQLTVPRKLDAWELAMTAVLGELRRLLKPGGCVAFEVGEIDHGMTRLENSVVRCGVAAGLEPTLILINAQEFTKTANCWGVDNNSKGTNTNRIVVFSNRTH